MAKDSEHAGDITEEEKAEIKATITGLLDGDWTEDQLVTIKAEIDTLFQKMDARTGNTEFSTG